MTLYSIKTRKGDEQTVASMIGEREHDDIHAALAPENMNSYIIVEAEDDGILERLIKDIPNAQKLVQGTVSPSEIESFFDTSRTEVENVSESDIVEVIDGPWSGETARVKNVDEKKEEVTIELTDATVGIPVTIPGHQVKRIDSEER